MPFTPRQISPEFDNLPLCDDEKALLRGCLETPWDDAPFLVYADWVEEHGDEIRAEFIRRTLGIYFDVVDDARAPKEIRAWGAKLDASLKNADFFRGLPSVRGLENLRWKAFTANKSKWKNISWDWCFYLHIKHISDQVLPEFLSESRLKNLMALALPFDLSNVMCQLIGYSPYLSNLTFLELPSADLTTEGLYHLVNSPNLTNVHTLDLSSNGLGDEGIRLLSRSSMCAQLQRLRLWDNNLTETSTRIIAENSNFSGLEYLDVLGNDLTEKAQSILRESPYLKRCVLRTKEWY